MPVKNTARFLKECINSILNQTFTDWELLAVDDHSTDDSLAILKSFAEIDERISVVENEDVGIIGALQTGYQMAKRRFITRMDSDDINEPQKYEHMMSQLEENGKGFVALGQVNYFSADGVQDGFRKYESWLNKLIVTGNCFQEIYKECVIPSPCWMLHRIDFERIGGFESQIYPEDYDLCFRMYKNELKQIACGEVLFNWRDYPSRTSRTNSNYKEEELLKLKCHYFLEIDFEKEKKLVLWGAGRRGKFIANYFIKKGISFTWICNNENKIGHDIYGVMLKSETALNNIPNKQIVVSVANDVEQDAIKKRCDIHGWERYFFC